MIARVRCAAAAAFLLLMHAGSLGAQTITYDAATLRDLPAGDSLFAVLETAEPAVIAERFTSGGLFAGQPSRVSGFQAPWSQTLFRVDGVTITDPALSGAPLVVPDLSLFERLRVTTRAVDDAGNHGGVVVDLDPVVPSDRWQRSFEASTSHGALAGSDTLSAVPAVARLDGWDRVSAAASGPIARDRLTAFFAGSWARGTQFERGEVEAARATLASAFSSAAFSPNDRDRIGLVGWFEHGSLPYAWRAPFGQPALTTRRTSGHAQIVWRHGEGQPRYWRAAAGYSGRRTTDDARDATTPIVFERLTDGPIAPLVMSPPATTQQWVLSAVAGRESAGRRVRMEIGGDARGGRIETSAFFTGTVGETVDGVPARRWVFALPPDAPRSSLRHNAIAGVFANGRFTTADRLTLRGGIRLESATGSADGATRGIAWHDVLPHAHASLMLASRWALTAYAGYARTTGRLALDYLAIGDPAAPAGDVSRWDGPLVARVGPGAGGTSNLSTIDAALTAPTTDEVVVGVEARPLAGFLLRVAGVSRRERHLLTIANVGAPPATAYSSFTVTDPGGDVLDPADDQVLTVYNRLPGSFGADRYLLTNGSVEGTFDGIEITLQVNTEHLTLMGGGTAGRAVTPAATLGFGPFENDETVLGDLRSDPNAAALARGRPFTDRAYTGKFATILRLPATVTLGAIARYQDGQPFARVRVFPQLNQGADAVRAFSNGDSRFMYIGTLDLRLQKSFGSGSNRVALFLDAFNVANLQNSVEEDVSEPPDVRVSTATQPPRSFILGIRAAF